MFSLAGLIDNVLIIGDEEIPLDGIVEVTPTNSRAVTSHPVEDGSTISDAIHQLPITMTFTAWVTDTAQSILDRRTYTNLANITGLDLLESHIIKQLKKLEKEANRGALVTLKTKYSKYTDYYLISFTYSESSRKGIAINFTIQERQVNNEDDRVTANFSSDLGAWS